MKTLVSTLVLSLSMAGMSQAQTIIYSQDFENTGGVMPSEITVIDGDNCDVPAPGTAYDSWRISTNSGDSCALVRSNFIQNPCTANDWLIIDTLLAILPHTKLKYDRGSSGAAAYEVYISITGSTQSDFLNTTPILRDTAFSSSIFIADTLDLTDYSGQNIYIAFRHTTTNGNVFGLDDIVVYNDTTVSVNRVNKANFTVYPNPADAQLTVKLPSANEAVLRVYNALGQEVHQGIVQNGQTDINTSSLVYGLYTISVQNGAQLQTERVLIQH